MQKRVKMKNYINIKVVIFGWYGTETLGDKAILGGIIEDLLEKGILEENIQVLSFNVNYTRITLFDLQYQDIIVKDVKLFKKNIAAIEAVDWFIFGGGPLCDIDEMIDMLEIVYQANNKGKETIIYACGIGPLNEKKYRYAFREIMKNSSKISFRDTQSVLNYKDLLLDIKKHNILIDPAVKYLRNKMLQPIQRIETDEYSMICIRKLPKLYTHGIQEEVYNEIVNSFERNVVNLIENYNDSGQKILLFPMHNYYVGDDDREYYLELCEKYNLWDKCEIIGNEYTVDEAIGYFNYANEVLAMRFHSVVFAATLNTNFIPIDYQYNDGKISGFLDEIKVENKPISIRNFDDGDFTKLIDYRKEFNWSQINKEIDFHVGKLNGFL